MISQEKPIYLDYAATTPVDERVIQAMLPYFSLEFGNPSSVHFFGQQAEAALEQSRENVATLLNAKPSEVIFTSGGTESDNLALRGIALTQKMQRGANHLLISPVDHPAVLATARQLAVQHGFELEYADVDEYGMVSADSIEAALRPTTALVSVIFANNEIGTINAVAEIGSVCRSHGIPFHSDAVQAAAHLKMDVKRDCVDALSIGAHKFYGPKGVGVLYIRDGIEIAPVQTGGSHEHALRAGTPNIPLSVGLAEAFRYAQEGVDERAIHFTSLRDRLIRGVLTNNDSSRLTGHTSQRLPNHASFIFESVDGNQLLMMLDQAGFCCSSGSACKTGNPKPSEVLEAIGIGSEWALGSLRVTIGKSTTVDDIDRFCEILPDQVIKARSSVTPYREN